MTQTKGTPMNILVIDNNAFGFDDVISIFKKQGHNLTIYKNPDISMHQNDEIFKELEMLIKKKNISLVFSFT